MPGLPMTDDESTGGAAPIASVIMANFEGGRSITDALHSVTAQTLGNIEIIVVDDASQDDSVARIRSAMRLDPRIRLIESTRNGGPARARNRALAMAQGKWIAIVDADDLIHPERLERLLAIALVERADIIADDLLHFYEDGSLSHYLLPDTAAAMATVSAEEWIVAGSNGTPALGYLKPLIRTDVLGDLRYDETLRIGEDYDLVLRLLLQGARFKLVAEPWYLYRRHSRSLSHRLRTDDVAAMIASQDRFVSGVGELSSSVRAALARRLDGLQQSLGFASLVDDIKRRHVRGACRALLRQPSLLLRLVQAVAEHWTRRMPATSGADATTLVPSLVTLAVSQQPPQRGDLLVVPAYQPIDAIPVSGNEGRSLWRTIADLSVKGTSFVPVGQAGTFALGFALPPAGVTRHQDANMSADRALELQ